MADGTKMSIAKYFMTEYGLKISSKKQPVIYVKRGKDRWLKIPSEFCIIDGVPDSIRASPRHMRDLLAKSRYDPNEKMK